MEVVSVFLDQQRTSKKLRGDFLLSLMQDEESKLKSEENAICHSQKSESWWHLNSIINHFVQISKQLTLYHLHTPILCCTEFPSLHPAKAAFTTALLNYLTFCVGTWWIEGQNINWPSLNSNSPPQKKYSAMHLGLWFLCTRSSSRPWLFEE
jgi:hypothetical protein